MAFDEIGYTDNTMNNSKQPEQAKQMSKSQPDSHRLNSHGLNSSKQSSSEPGSYPLNHYLAICGAASRRGAVALIAQKKVSVNGKIITTPGFRVTEDDMVRYKGKILRPEVKTYIVLNKPSGYVTTRSDEVGRQTVLDLLGSTAKMHRLYPVGRLDMTTTGVLLLTNDGDLAQKLAHPSKKISKIYIVTLDRPFNSEDSPRLLKGVRLDDGVAAVDRLDQKAPQVIEVAIHSGRNRIVRRLFEYLGYRIKSLDRVAFAGLTVRGLPRGGWRRLTASELRKLGV